MTYVAGLAGLAGTFLPNRGIPALALLLLLVPPAAAQQVRQPLLIPGKTSLYQRVITRLGAGISPTPAATGATPVPGFAVYYVYARQGGPDGWVEVGPGADGRTQGWLPAGKTIEWKHALVGSFTSLANRQRALFLDTERNERLLIMARDAAAKADAMRAEAAAGRPGPVLAVEPANTVDINERFYLLPILDAELIEREQGPPLRLLKVASAPAPPPPTPEPGDALRNYKGSIVFLIDTTSSMQQYIDRTRDAVRSFVDRIGSTAVKDNFRFGVVGYRDSLEDNPGLEYPYRIFARPDFTKPAAAVLEGLGQLRESRVSSTGFDEDPIGGLKGTLDEIDWSGLSGRIVILITDAGAREATHPHSLTRLGITEIRTQAEEKKVIVMALHLLTPDGARRNDHAPARAQYENLTRVNGSTSRYFPIAGGNPALYQQTVELLVQEILQGVATATGVPVETLRLPPAPAIPGQERIREQMRLVNDAMRLDYVGRTEQARAPDVTTSWTVDRDLANPEAFSIEARVLLTRNQLSDLTKSLQTILATGLAGRTSPETFFGQLQTAFAATVTDPARIPTDPSRIAQATRIGGLLGEYLEGLPYRSEIMGIDQDAWVAMGPVAQRVVLNNVESRLRLYQDYQANGRWRDVTGTGRAGEQVYAVPLEALP